ncbi:HAMP domain-containing sensor histidine kinase [Bacillus gobiensis]|uniref:HAMP domain-containing sensor histidine kinase n=1 Tax=Bacillus gobiensis TaxID=1441095 RepID=UPI003D212873
MKWRHSILTRYLLVVFFALILLPMGLPIVSLLIYTPFDMQHKSQPYSEEKIERDWHQEVSTWMDLASEERHESMKQWKERYPGASFFIVNKNGRTSEKLPENLDVQEVWNSGTTAEFIKKRYGNDPYTVIAFIGNDQKNGFAVFQMPRSVLLPRIQQINGLYLGLGLLFLLLIFIAASLWFIIRLRNRIRHLQQTMDHSENGALPSQVKIGKMDEIGQLQNAFNKMVVELEKSRKREQEEESLRRQLISNLSHDLRTPLTTLQAHTYSLSRERLSDTGRESVQILDQKITLLDRLIDNLLSYTLLTAGKYHMDIQELDINRFLRSQVASWYPVFENEGIEVDVDLHPLIHPKWHVDIHWMERIVDNLFQNVVRHAKQGGYIRIHTLQRDSADGLIIEDRGPGFAGISKEAGAGIGLTIVSKMIKDMNMDWKIASSETGAKICIYYPH